MRIMRTILIFCLLIVVEKLFSQTVAQKLERAWSTFSNDSQMRHAIAGFSVMDNKTGKLVFERNAQVGLAPASTQKIIISVAAFEFLGKEYRYKTEFGYEGTITNDILDGSFYLLGKGDPTLGSWRWETTKTEKVFNRIRQAIGKLKLKSYNKPIISDCSAWEDATIPDGWIWQDIGNYYGAYPCVFNWRENQFDVVLNSSSIRGQPVRIVNFSPSLYNYKLHSQVQSAAKGSGDNAYIYYPLTKGEGIIKGTIPVGEDAFRISGSFPDPLEQLMGNFKDSILIPLNISSDSSQAFYQTLFYYGQSYIKGARTTIHTEHSPTLDSINYHFLRKSINLYGETLIKTIALEKSGFGSAEKGIELVQDFFASKVIDKTALNIVDGSGLSPQNRVTANALVKVLQYAKSRPWFSSFFLALPEYNGMKMKSGSISGARAYAGYHKATDGKEYTFSIIVNNFDGSSSEMVKKMYKLLDVLK